MDHRTNNEFRPGGPLELSDDFEDAHSRDLPSLAGGYSQDRADHVDVAALRLEGNFVEEPRGGRGQPSKTITFPWLVDTF